MCAFISLTVLIFIELSSSASYVVVDTDQALCYDHRTTITCPAKGNDYFGQDGTFTENPPQYTDNSDGTITDLNTGLMWLKNYGEKKTWQAAETELLTYSFAGHSDWRMPTITELYSLILFSGIDIDPEDPSGGVPFIDTDFFDFEYGTDVGDRAIDMQYITSTIYTSTTMGGNPTMFGVNFADGRIKGYGYTGMKTFCPLYVRGESYGVNNFRDNDDGTITDLSTMLMWQKEDSGSGMNWKAALDYVMSKNTEKLLGYDDWRLPHAKELQSIVDYTSSPDHNQRAAIDPIFEITAIENEDGQTDYPYFWTGTTHARVSPQAPGGSGAYLCFGRCMGYMQDAWIDVHGAGAQRSDPKDGNPADYPNGRGPQGDAIRINNFLRLVRGGDANVTINVNLGFKSAGNCNLIVVIVIMIVLFFL